MTGWDDHVTDRIAVVDPADVPDRVDVLVVGMGASGLAAAGHAARRGASVLAVDAVGIAAGAAGRNGGFLLAGLADFHHDAVARHGRDVALDWFRRTADEIDRLADAHPDLVRRTGSLRIAATGDENVDIEAQLAAMHADGLDVEPYDGPEGRGLLVPGDAAVNPVARCHLLARDATSAGAHLAAPHRVPPADLRVERNPAGVPPADLRVERDPARVRPADVRGERSPGRVRLADVRVERGVVVAVDGGLGAVVPEVAGRVRTARLQMLATAPDVGVALPRPVYRRYGYDYVQQLPSGEVLLGGGRDVDVDAWTADAAPSAEVQEHLDRLLADLGVTADVTHRWAAHAGFTDTGLPIAEEVRPGVFAVGGYCGHGNVLGPLLACDAVDAALDGTTFAPFS